MLLISSSENFQLIGSALSTNCLKEQKKKMSSSQWKNSHSNYEIRCESSRWYYQRRKSRKDLITFVLYKRRKSLGFSNEFAYFSILSRSDDDFVVELKKNSSLSSRASFTELLSSIENFAFLLREATRRRKSQVVDARLEMIKTWSRSNKTATKSKSSCLLAGAGELECTRRNQYRALNHMIITSTSTFSFCRSPFSSQNKNKQHKALAFRLFAIPQKNSVCKLNFFPRLWPMPVPRNS